MDRRWDGRMDGWTNGWSWERVEETGTGNSKVQRENERTEKLRLFIAKEIHESTSSYLIANAYLLNAHSQNSTARSMR